jgi:hypothetical protein
MLWDSIQLSAQWEEGRGTQRKEMNGRNKQRNTDTNGKDDINK